MVYGELSNSCLSLLVESLAGAMLACSCVALLFFPPQTVFVAIIATCAINVQLLGISQLYGLVIGPCELTTFVMSVGITLDFLIHVIEAAETASGTAKVRVAVALSHITRPIMLSGTSTILGVVVLSFTKQSTLRTFSALTATIVIFGWFHALLFVPVMIFLLTSHCGGRGKDETGTPAVAVSTDEIALSVVVVGMTSTTQRKMSELCHN